METTTVRFTKFNQNNWPVYINIEQIISFYINGKGTKIITTRDHYVVDEDLKTVIELIKGN